MEEEKIYPILSDEDFESYEGIKGNFGVVLYSKKRLREIETEEDLIFVRDELPGEMMLVLEVLMRESDNVYYHIPVDTELVVREVLDMDEMFEDAFAIMSKSLPLVFEKTTDIVKISPLFEDPNFYVVHTDEMFGASAFFYPGVQDQIAEKLGHSYFVLPISREFLIVAADDGTKDLGRLQDILIEQNERDDTTEDTFLSNDVLYYDANTHVLDTANSAMNRGKVIYINSTGGYEN